MACEFVLESLTWRLAKRPKGSVVETVFSCTGGNYKSIFVIYKSIFVIYF